MPNINLRKGFQDSGFMGFNLQAFHFAQRSIPGPWTPVNTDIPILQRIILVKNGGEYEGICRPEK